MPCRNPPGKGAPLDVYLHVGVFFRGKNTELSSDSKGILDSKGDSDLLSRATRILRWEMVRRGGKGFPEARRPEHLTLTNPSALAFAF